MEGSTIGKSYPGMPSSQDGVVHLVDHTPSEIDSSVQKNSVAWLVNVESGISGDETDDAGASWRGSEQAAAPSAPSEEDQVVDRIPQGAQSRYGDASTLVVADPSEVLSHVGDLLQEDDFGPVVDLTPPSRPAALNVISAAASTAVVAPTVGPDDLDDADADDTVNAAEDNGWEGDPSEVEAPNPQSGNEEPARVREQVVDFLPPQQEQAPDQNRDGWSEVATGAEPSVMAADPKEDEFGRKRIFGFSRALSAGYLDSNDPTRFLCLQLLWTNSLLHILALLLQLYQLQAMWLLRSVMPLPSRTKKTAPNKEGLLACLSAHCPMK